MASQYFVPSFPNYPWTWFDNSIEEQRKDSYNTVGRNTSFNCRFLMKILKAVTNQNSFLHSQRRSLHPGRLTIRSILQDDESSSGDRMASVWHFTTNGRTARIAPRSPPIEFAPSSSPLPYAVFARTLFEFDPIKSSSPFDWVIFRWVDLWRRH